VSRCAGKEVKGGVRGALTHSLKYHIPEVISFSWPMSEFLISANLDNGSISLCTSSVTMHFFCVSFVFMDFAHFLSYCCLFYLRAIYIVGTIESL
jgi:hypothetical protein